MLLAVDPSVRSPGAALFDNDAVLFAVTRIVMREDKRESTSDGARWLSVARDIVAWAGGPITRFIYEKPQIYRGAKSKGDPNDLIGLAGVGAAISGIIFAGNPHVQILTPTPAEWIGQVPKTTKGSAKISPRAQRILSRLSPEELKLVPDQHDAIDAIGLGLFACGRLETRRVYSSGS